MVTRTDAVQALSGVICRGADARPGLAVVCLWLPVEAGPNLTTAQRLIFQLYWGAKAVRVLQKLYLAF